MNQTTKTKIVSDLESLLIYTQKAKATLVTLIAENPNHTEIEYWKFSLNFYMIQLDSLQKLLKNEKPD